MAKMTLMIFWPKYKVPQAQTETLVERLNTLFVSASKNASKKVSSDSANNGLLLVVYCN